LADRQKRLQTIRQAKAALERQAREEAEQKHAPGQPPIPQAQPEPEQMVNRSDAETRA
jgi:type II secretory pathway component PulM